MILRIQSVNVNLAGDGESKTVDLDLSKDVSGTIVGVVGITLRGATPLPECFGEVVDGKVHVRFSQPLAKYDKGNGYSAMFFLEVA